MNILGIYLEGKIVQDIEIFKKYVSNYDLNDPNIEQKFFHSIRVSNNAKEIAESINLNDKDKVDAKAVSAKVKELKKANDIGEEFAVLSEYIELSDTVSKQNKIVKELNAELEIKVKVQYSELTDGEILELLVNRKWYYTVSDGIKNLYVTASHNMANRIIELAERYEDTLPSLNTEADELEKRVTVYLERMGFKWK